MFQEKFIVRFFILYAFLKDDMVCAPSTMCSPSNALSTQGFRFQILGDMQSYFQENVSLIHVVGNWAAFMGA